MYPGVGFYGNFKPDGLTIEIMPSDVSKDSFPKCDPIVRSGSVESTCASVRHNSDDHLQILQEGSALLAICKEGSAPVDGCNSLQ